MILDLFFALAVTLAIETIIYLILDWKSLKLFIVCSAANIILNTSMNVVLLQLDRGSLYWILLASFEVATILIESLVIFLFCRYPYPKTLLVAALANVLSFLIGFLFIDINQNMTFEIVVTVLFFVLYFALYAYILIFYIKSKQQNP